MEAALTEQDLSWLDKFRVEATRFRDAFLALGSTREFAQSRPELKAEYDALSSRGQTIKSTVEYITRTVDQVTGFFSDAWASTSSAAKRFFGLGIAPPRNLGIIPLIPIAAITGAVALMAKFVSDVYLFERKVGEQKRLEDQGLSPGEASSIVRNTVGGGLFDVLGGLKWPLLAAGGVWFFVKVIQPALQSRRGS